MVMRGRGVDHLGLRRPAPGGRRGAPGRVVPDRRRALVRQRRPGRRALDGPGRWPTTSDGRGHVRPDRLHPADAGAAGTGAHVRRGRACPARGAARPPAAPSPMPELPLLLNELAITQNWLGDLAEAEVNLTTAIGLCRTRNLPALRDLRDDPPGVHPVHAGPRAGLCRGRVRGARAARRATSPGARTSRPPAPRLALRAGDLVRPALADPAPAAAATGGSDAVHPADLCTRFWLRMRAARHGADGRAP